MNENGNSSVNNSVNNNVDNNVDNNAYRSLFLKSGTVHITADGRDAYKVTRGRMLVFIVPVEGKNTGRRTFLYEAGEGETVPGLMYRDLNYKYWAFCFASTDGCEVNILKGGAAEEIRRDFARRAQIPNYEIEGFEESVVDCRRIKALAEDNFIRRSAGVHSRISGATAGIVDDAVYPERTGLNVTGEPLYDCIAYLCAKTGAGIAPVHKVLEMYGEDYTVYDVARLSGFACMEVPAGGGDAYYGACSDASSGVYSGKNDAGSAGAKEPFITEGPGGRPVVCIPGRRGAVLYDPETGVKTPVKEAAYAMLADGGERACPGAAADFIPAGKNANLAGTGACPKKAYYIRRALPARKLETRDVAAFCAKSIRPVCAALLCVSVLLCASAAFLLPLKGRELADAALPGGEAGKAVKTALVLTAAAAIYGILSAIRGITRRTISSKLEFDLQNALYHRLFHMPESFLKRFDTAALAAGAAGAGKAAGTFAGLTVSAVSAFLTGIAAVAGICLCSSAGPAVCAGAMLLFSLIIWFAFGKLSSKYRAEYRERSGELSSRLYRFVGGIEEIRGAGAEDHVLYELMRSYVELGELSEKYRKRKRAAAAVSGVLGAAVLALGYVTFPNIYGAAGDSGFIAFCIYAAILFECAAAAGSDVRGLLSCGACAGTLRELMNEAPEYGSAEEAAPVISGAIELSGVSFRYSEDTPLILENVNVSIKAGEYVAVAGPSGCGKTTLIKLLLGFIAPTSGRIYYDNHDLGTVDRGRLRACMGVVLQEDKLLEGNILDNIRAARPGATDAQVRRAMDLACLTEDVAKLPMGLMTVVSRGGGGFSYSLYRRILIARALITNPRILIFDEADANLDSRSAKELRAAIASMSCTRIIVTHDPESVKDCGRIITLDASGHASCNKQPGAV